MPNISEQYFHATVPRPAIIHPSLLDLSCGLQDYQPQLVNNPVRHALNAPTLSATHDQDDDAAGYPDLSKSVSDLPNLEPWFSKAFQSSVNVNIHGTVTAGRNVMSSRVS